VGILVIGTTGRLARALGAAAPGLTRLGRAMLDLVDAAAAEAVVLSHAPDLVINAAAYTAVDQAEADVAAAYAVNRDGVEALARRAARAGAALVHVSTDYVFDGSKVCEWVETDPTGPLGTYGASKRAGEAAALAANPRTLVLRTSWVYSPWEKNFVGTMLRLADRERLPVVDDQHGKPTSALYLAEAILAIAPRLAAAPAGAACWGVRHYAGRGITTWARFAREIFAQARGRLIAAGAGGGADPDQRLSDPGPAAAELGPRLLRLRARVRDCDGGLADRARPGDRATDGGTRGGLNAFLIRPAVRWNP